MKPLISFFESWVDRGPTWTLPLLALILVPVWLMLKLVIFFLKVVRSALQ